MGERLVLIGAVAGAIVAFTWIIFGFWPAVLLVVLSGLGALIASLVGSGTSAELLEKLRNR